MCIIEHVIGGHVEVLVLILIDVHLLYLLQLASKVSSVAHQIHILYLTGFIWWWSQGSKLQFENFHQCPGDKMSGGELLGSTTLSTLKFCILTLWCTYFEYPLSFPVAIHFLNSENSGQITRDLSYFWDTWVLVRDISTKLDYKFHWRDFVVLSGSSWPGRVFWKWRQR